MKQDKICDKTMSFSECELAILRVAVDKAEEKVAKRIVSSDDIKKILVIVENFIKRKKLICYGGTAINNILPIEDQFYNKEIDIPDYDFFSVDALYDAKELADIYYKHGFTDVEAKSGQHHGTYKVFVNYMPIADLTYIPTGIFNSLKKDAIKVAGILYASANFLRMSMYLELSRPVGDTSRWEKVLKRLILLNKHHPLRINNCESVEFQRKMDNIDQSDTIYETVRNTFIDQGVVFFGGYAITQYSQYMPIKLRNKLEKIADFDVLSNDPETTAEIVKERLTEDKVKNVKILKRTAIGEIIPDHYEIRVDYDTIAFIYKPIACHNYNIIKLGNRTLKIATIDTMLSFYLAFLYANRQYYKEFSDRILCMSKFLFDVQQKNRLEQKGLLKRFSIKCYGHQNTIEEIRAEKAAKFKELKDNKNSREYQEWFLNYKPYDAEYVNSETNSTKIKRSINHSKKSTKKNTHLKTKSIIGNSKRKIIPKGLNKSKNLFGFIKTKKNKIKIY